MKLSDVVNLEVDEIIAFMRSRGIMAMAFGAHSISLADQPQPEVIPDPTNFEDETIKLDCGHAIWEANEAGECLLGCKKEDVNAKIEE
jgi:hypothetical protein